MVTRIARHIFFSMAFIMPAHAQQPADLIEMSASDAAGAIASGRVSSRALTEALIARSKDKASLNAVITLNEKNALAPIAAC